MTSTLHSASNLPGLRNRTQAARAIEEDDGIINKTAELYKIPYVRKEGEHDLTVSKECRTWPVFRDGVYKWGSSGESMLSLSEDEKRALQIVVLRTNVKQENFGASHFFNWKKVGLSRAYFKQQLVCESNMPTLKAKQAFRWLRKENAFYEVRGSVLIE